MRLLAVGLTVLLAGCTEEPPPDDDSAASAQLEELKERLRKTPRQLPAKPAAPVPTRDPLGPPTRPPPSASPSSPAPPVLGAPPSPAAQKLPEVSAPGPEAAKVGDYVDYELSSHSRGGSETQATVRLQAVAKDDKALTVLVFVSKTSTELHPLLRSGIRIRLALEGATPRRFTPHEQDTTEIAGHTLTTAHYDIDQSAHDGPIKHYTRAVDEPLLALGSGLVAMSWDGTFIATGEGGGAQLTGFGHTAVPAGATREPLAFSEGDQWERARNTSKWTEGPYSTRAGRVHADLSDLDLVEYARRLLIAGLRPGKVVSSKPATYTLDDGRQIRARLVTRSVVHRQWGQLSVRLAYVPDNVDLPGTKRTVTTSAVIELAGPPPAGMPADALLDPLEERSLDGKRWTVEERLLSISNEAKPSRKSGARPGGGGVTSGANGPWSGPGKAPTPPEVKQQFKEAMSQVKENPAEAQRLFLEVMRHTPPDDDYHRKAEAAAEKLEFNR